MSNSILERAADSIPPYVHTHILLISCDGEGWAASLLLTMIRASSARVLGRLQEVVQVSAF